jgi:hypothetical protein
VDDMVLSIVGGESPQIKGLPVSESGEKQTEEEEKRLEDQRTI